MFSCQWKFSERNGKNFWKKKKKNIDTDFKISNGWFEKLKNRDGLVFKKLCAESASVDFNNVSECRKEQFKHLLDKFDPKDVYNADETGLYYKLLPNISIVMKSKTGPGIKKVKEWLFFLQLTWFELRNCLFLS